MAQSRSAAAPLIAAVITGVLMAGSILLWVFGRVDDQPDGAQTYTSTERAAVSAASTEMANLLTFRRSAFEADFQRALAGTTGALRSDITKQKAATLKSMTEGKFDLKANVTHTGLVGPVAKGGVKGYVVLVTIEGFRSSQANLPTPQNLQATVVRSKGKWLVNDVTAIGVS
jgi:hypothetical protein